jgi:hypothetical protein
VEPFPIVDLVEGAVHASGTDKVRASVSKAGILAPTNFGNCLDGEQIRPLAVVDGQVSGIGDVSPSIKCLDQARYQYANL